MDDPEGTHGGFDAADQAADEHALEWIDRLERLLSKPPRPPDADHAWPSIDLTDALAGTRKGATPTFLPRTDNRALIYPGKRHALSGEPESGKGWLAVAAVADIARHKRRVAYYDFETDEHEIVGRLLAANVDPEWIRYCFRYYRPDNPLDPGQHAPQPNAHLAIIDGITEALALCGLDPNNAPDIAKWEEILPQPLARLGAAVLSIDHVVKDKESRGRYGFGSQHKLAAADVSYGLEIVDPFGRGKDGLSRIVVHKDRPGYVRAHATGKYVADMRMSSTDAGDVQITLDPPASPGAASTFRPTGFMERISKLIEQAPGINRTRIMEDVTGKKQHKNAALTALIDEQYVTTEKHGKEVLHNSAQPYRETDGLERGSRGSHKVPRNRVKQRGSRFPP